MWLFDTTYINSTETKRKKPEKNVYKKLLRKYKVKQRPYSLKLLRWKAFVELFQKFERPFDPDLAGE